MRPANPLHQPLRALIELAPTGSEERSPLEGIRNHTSARPVPAEYLAKRRCFGPERPEYMPRQSRRAELEDFTDIKQFTSTSEIALAIRRLQRCLAEVRGLRTSSADFDGERARSVQFNIRVAILEIFGPNSPEFGEYGRYEIYSRAPRSLPEVGLGTFRNVNQARFIRELPQTESMLEALITRLNDKRIELLSPSKPRTKVAFENLQLHPLIANACSGLYRGGHYKQAVLEGSIALVNCVKEKSRQDLLDGSGLMGTVFSPKNPLLAFNRLKSKADKDEQEGFMHLFLGAVLALRNPRAHAIFDDSPESALDYIALLSMLAKRLDGARRV